MQRYKSSPDRAAERTYGQFRRQGSIACSQRQWYVENHLRVSGWTSTCQYEGSTRTDARLSSCPAVWCGVWSAAQLFVRAATQVQTCPFSVLSNRRPANTSPGTRPQMCVDVFSPFAPFLSLGHPRFRPPAHPPARGTQAHTTAFVEPISVEFAGVRVHEVPPNGQGIAALLALNILKELGVVDEAKRAAACAGERTGEGGGEGGAGVAAAAEAAEAATKKDGGGETAYLHRLIEVLRLAFADTRWYCADMDKADVPVKELLGQPYAAERARLFDPARCAKN